MSYGMRFHANPYFRYSSFVRAARCLSAGAFVVVFLVRAIAYAANPAPTATPITTCAVGVLAVLPLGGDDPSGQRGRDFAAFLYAENDGVASGKLWVNASGTPYSVPFSQRAVIGYSLKGRVDAIAFRLPAEASLENAFVDSIDDGTTPSPCAITNSWTPQITHTLDEQLIKKLRGVTPPELIDVQPIADPSKACGSRGYPPNVVQAAQVVAPKRTFKRSDVQVEIMLRADSGLVKAVIEKSPDPDLNKASIAAAEGSVYQTFIHDCQPKPATYIFIVTYGSGPFGT
jgi:hypothetical protein